MITRRIVQWQKHESRPLFIWINSGVPQPWHKHDKVNPTAPVDIHPYVTPKDSKQTVIQGDDNLCHYMTYSGLPIQPYKFSLKLQAVFLYIVYFNHTMFLRELSFMCGLKLEKSL